MRSLKIVFSNPENIHGWFDFNWKQLEISPTLVKCQIKNNTYHFTTVHRSTRRWLFVKCFERTIKQLKYMLIKPTADYMMQTLGRTLPVYCLHGLLWCFFFFLSGQLASCSTTKCNIIPTDFMKPLGLSSLSHQSSATLISPG